MTEGWSASLWENFSLFTSGAQLINHMHLQASFLYNLVRSMIFYHLVV